MKKTMSIYIAFKKATIILAFFIGFFMLFQSIVSSYNLFQKKNKVYQEEQRLQQVELIRDSLKNDIAYTQNDVFIEQEARNKLGLIKSEEKIVYVLDEPLSNANNGEGQKMADRENVSFVRKWIMLFFRR